MIKIENMSMLEEPITYFQAIIKEAEPKACTEVLDMDACQVDEDQKHSEKYISEQELKRLSVIEEKEEISIDSVLLRAGDVFQPSYHRSQQPSLGGAQSDNNLYSQETSERSSTIPVVKFPGHLMNEPHT